MGAICQGGGYAISSAYLLFGHPVCLCADSRKNSAWIYMSFSPKVGLGPASRWFRFGGDLHHLEVTVAQQPFGITNKDACMKANVARRNGKRCGQTYYKATTLIGSRMCLLLSNDVILDDLEAGFRVKPGNNVEKLPPVWNFFLRQRPPTINQSINQEFLKWFTARSVDCWLLTEAIFGLFSDYSYNKVH